MQHNHFEQEEIKALVSLASFTTLKVGGPAEWIGEPTNIKELTALISWSKQKKIPCQIIGAGSNLLISDDGIKC